MVIANDAPISAEASAAVAAALKDNGLQKAANFVKSTQDESLQYLKHGSKLTWAELARWYGINDGSAALRDEQIYLLSQNPTFFSLFLSLQTTDDSGNNVWMYDAASN